jgi:hypothetical protein
MHRPDKETNDRLNVICAVTQDNLHEFLTDRKFNEIDSQAVRIRAGFLKGSPKPVLFSTKLLFILLLLDQIVFNFFVTRAPKFNWPPQSMYPRHYQHGFKLRSIKANLHHIIHITNTGKMMDTLEKFCIYRETEAKTQINDKLTVQNNAIF